MPLVTSAIFFAMDPRSKGVEGLSSRRGLLHVGGHGQASPSPQTATLPKSSEEIERCVIASFRVVESMGFKGEFRQTGGSAADWRLRTAARRS